MRTHVVARVQVLFERASPASAHGSLKMMKMAGLLVAGLLGGSAASGGAGLPLYKQAAAPISERVADLLKRMTLDEKVNQTLNDFYAGAFGRGVTGPADAAVPCTFH